MANVRQSTVNTATDCGQKLAYSLDPDTPYGSGVNRGMGTALHAGHEVYYAGRQAGRTDLSVADYVDAAVASFDDEVAKTGDRFDWVFQPQTTRKALRVLTRDECIAMVAEVITNYHEQEWFWPLDYEVVSVEQRFLLPLEGTGHSVTGTPDLLLRAPDEYLWGVDHKTAKDKPKKNKFSAAESVQAAIYSWAASQLHGTTKVAFAFDVMPWSGGFYRVEEHRTAAQINASLQQVVLVGDLIEAKGPFLPNPSSFLCSQAYCDHWDYCPFGKVLNK